MQLSIAVGFDMWGLFEEVEKELDTCIHYFRILRYSPLHEFSQRLHPRFDSVLVDDFAREEGECRHCF